MILIQNRLFNVHVQSPNGELCTRYFLCEKVTLAEGGVYLIHDQAGFLLGAVPATHVLSFERGEPE